MKTRVNVIYEVVRFSSRDSSRGVYKRVKRHSARTVANGKDVQDDEKDGTRSRRR
jgi:hypothetical protein